MESLHSKFKVKHKVETCRVLTSLDVDHIPRVYECGFNRPDYENGRPNHGTANPNIVTSVCVYENDDSKVVFRNDNHSLDLKKIDMKGPVLKIFVSTDFYNDGQLVVLYQGKDKSDFSTAILKYGGIDKIVRKSVVKRHLWNPHAYVKGEDDHSSLGSRILQSDFFNYTQEEPDNINRAFLEIQEFKAFASHNGCYAANSYIPDHISTDMKEIRFIKKLVRSKYSISSAIVFGSYRLLSRNSRHLGNNGYRISVLSPSSWHENYMFLSTRGIVDIIETNDGFAGLGVVYEGNYLIYFHWSNGLSHSYGYDPDRYFTFSAPGATLFCFSKNKLYTVGNWGTEIRVYNNLQTKYTEAARNVIYSPLRNLNFSANVLNKGENTWRGTHGKLSINEAENVKNRYRGIVEDFQRFELGEPDTFIDLGESVLKMKTFSEGLDEVLVIVSLDQTAKNNCLVLNTSTNTILFNQKFNKNITDIDYKIYKARPVEAMLSIKFCKGEETLRFELPKKGVNTIEIKNAHIDRIARSSSSNDRVGRHIDI
jgi:hypothetical protein